MGNTIDHITCGAAFTSGVGCTIGAVWNALSIGANTNFVIKCNIRAAEADKLNRCEESKKLNRFVQSKSYKFWCNVDLMQTRIRGMFINGLQESCGYAEQSAAFKKYPFYEPTLAGAKKLIGRNIVFGVDFAVAAVVFFTLSNWIFDKSAK